MKICVLFDSKTGNTRQLAERISARPAENTKNSSKISRFRACSAWAISIGVWIAR